MMRHQRRWFHVVLLVAAALLWVGVLSLPFGGASPGHSRDGTTARITHIDDRTFPRVDSYLLLQNTAGEPIGGLPAQDFTVTEDGIPVPFDFAGAGAQPLSVVLVIDRSGSMKDDGKLAGAQAAARAFVDRLRVNQDSLGVAAFSSHTETLVPLTPLQHVQQKTSAETAIAQIAAEGDTLLYDAIADAIAQLQGQSGRRVVIALTDGKSDDGRYSVETSSAAAQQTGVPIYTIGLGADVDDQTLRQLAATTGGTYAFAPNAAELEALYRELADALEHEYRFSYRSPTPHLDGTRRTVAVTARRAGDTVAAADGYAVSGVLVLQRNPVVLVALFGSLLGLLAAPSVLRRRQSVPTGVGARAQPLVSAPVPAATSEGSRTARSAAGAAVARRPAGWRHLLHVASRAVPWRGQAGGPRILPLHVERTTIGSAASNDIVLPGLAPRHAVISRRSGHWVIEPLDGPTLVAFQGPSGVVRTITSVNALKQGSLIWLGSEQAIFHDGDAPGLLVGALQTRQTADQDGRGVEE